MKKKELIQNTIKGIKTGYRIGSYFTPPIPVTHAVVVPYGAATKILPKLIGGTIGGTVMFAKTLILEESKNENTELIK